MNETHKEERLSTADLVVGVAEKEPNGQKDMPIAHQAEAKPMALLPEDEVNDFQTRWRTIQTGFVDEPRSAVEEADSLVAEIMKHLAETFADERAGLEEQWTRGDDVSTEDLRLTLQRYRSFFHRLLSL